MLKLTIKNLEQDRIDTRFGSEDELLKYAEMRYPETQTAWTLEMAVSALNETGLYEAAVAPWEPTPRRLAEDYATASGPATEDPWPRKG